MGPASTNPQLSSLDDQPTDFTSSRGCSASSEDESSVMSTQSSLASSESEVSWWFFSPIGLKNLISFSLQSDCLDSDEEHRHNRSDRMVDRSPLQSFQHAPDRSSTTISSIGLDHSYCAPVPSDLVSIETPRRRVVSWTLRDSLPASFKHEWKCRFFRIRMVIIQMQQLFVLNKSS